MSHSKLLSPNKPHIQRNNHRNDGNISRSFNSPSKISIRSNKSRNIGGIAQSSSNESKLKQYMNSVKEMYNNQMEIIKSSNEKSKFYATVNSPNKVCFNYLLL